jgi:hypothetical protein
MKDSGDLEWIRESESIPEDYIPEHVQSIRQSSELDFPSSQDELAACIALSLTSPQQQTEDPVEPMPQPSRSQADLEAVIDLTEDNDTMQIQAPEREALDFSQLGFLDQSASANKSPTHQQGLTSFLFGEEIMMNIDPSVPKGDPFLRELLKQDSNLRTPSILFNLENRDVEVAILVDNRETGRQNGRHHFLEQFQKRRILDPVFKDRQHAIKAESKTLDLGDFMFAVRGGKLAACQ